MRKNISLGFAVLLFFSSHAQQQSTMISTEGRTRNHPVIQLSTSKQVSYSLPARAILHEFYDGKRLFSASCKRSMLNGEWKSWYTKGHLCDSGRVINNLPDGEWKFWDAQGRLQAVRTYSAAKYDRVSEEIRRYHPRRSFYTIAALAQQNKPAALHYLRAAYSFPAVQSSSQFNSLRDLVRSNTNGSGPYVPVFTDCLHDGLYMNFFTNGQARDSGYYKEGLRHGKWMHRDAMDGNRYEGAYQHGNRVKEWKQYDHQGKLIRIEIYQHGQVSWSKRYNN